MIKYETLRNDIIQYAIWKLGKNHSYIVRVIDAFNSLSNYTKELFESMSDEQLDKIFFAYADAIAKQAKESKN